MPFEEGPAPVPAAPVDALGELAQQVMEEARQRFDPADRLALRLHVDGHSCAEIAELIGKSDRTWVWHRLERMKRQLREIFQHHWDGLYQ